MVKKLVILALIVMVLAGCTAAPNQFKKVPNAVGELDGFWSGLWHGIIAPFMFIASLFSDKFGIYEVHNNGNWYNFGFILGLSIILGGSGGGAGRKSRR